MRRLKSLVLFAIAAGWMLAAMVVIGLLCFYRRLRRGRRRCTKVDAG